MKTLEDVTKSYGAVIASIVQFVGVLIYIAHWQATVDQRLTTVESQQSSISANMDRLNSAREADQIHLTHVDDKLGDMFAKVSAIFNIMTQSGSDDVTTPETPSASPTPPPNFRRPQGRGN